MAELSKSTLDDMVDQRAQNAPGDLTYQTLGGFFFGGGGGKKQSRDIESPAILDLLMATEAPHHDCDHLQQRPAARRHAYEALAADAFARSQRRKLGPANVTF